MIDFKKLASKFKKKKQSEPRVTDDVYPCWKYHAFYNPRLVGSKEEELLLGYGWENSPAYFDKKEVI